MHLIRIERDEQFPHMPFHASCSCGTAGHFPTRKGAVDYMTQHAMGQRPGNVQFFLDETLEKAQSA